MPIHLAGCVFPIRKLIIDANTKTILKNPEMKIVI
jgi:hypothetical protein